MSEFRNLTREDIKVFEQLAKTNVAQPINPDLTYCLKGGVVIGMLNKMAQLHNEVRHSYPSTKEAEG